MEKKIIDCFHCSWSLYKDVKLHQNPHILFSKNVSPVFLSQICAFYRKKPLIFTNFNVNMHPLFFKVPIFFEIVVSRKSQTRFFRGESVGKEWQEIDLYHIFLCTFSLFKVRIFHWKLILRKRDFEFSPTKNNFVFLKQ